MDNRRSGRKAHTCWNISTRRAINIPTQSDSSNGHVLIWTIGDVTYRLESELSIEEAVKIAESVR